MFFDTFAALCKSIGKKPTPVAAEIGISKSTVSNWKNKGGTPHADQLQKIAEYFGVSVDSLLDKEKAPTAGEDSSERHEKERLAIELTEDLSASEMQKVQDYVAFLKSKRNR